MKTGRRLINKEMIYGTIPSWGQNVYDDFISDLLSENNPFPCILGVEGFKGEQLRFCFIESTEQADIKKLASHLKIYINEFKKIGRNTSFVAFFKPNEMQSIKNYEKQFWDILQQLHEQDEKEWPAQIPKDTDDPLWEFSFHKEPLFVVCNTPAHKKRKSRYSSTFMMTFQPRWVFEGMNASTKKGQKVQKIVRDRLKNYDQVDAHPELAWYGDPETREWKQYFLDDDNQRSSNGCPFHASIKEDNKMSFSKAKIEKNKGGSMEEVVREIIPEATGYVEIQNDAPNKAHPSHTHPTDEILHILEGSISFTVDDETTMCHPGDRIYLPKETVHSSIAGPEGCLYVISIQKQ